MGLRGFIRDLLGLYIGVRLLLSVIFPLTPDEAVFFGFIIFGFSLWFTLERVGFLGG